MLSRRQLIAAGAASLALPGRLGSEEARIDIENLLPGEFTWHPERSPQGAVAVIASLPEQRVHVYRNGVRIAVSTCSTGKPGHATPTGVFTILQKDANHRSSTYNGAPMPNMNRLTWDGIALHAGNLPGYPASHGCVRLPLEFSRLLFTVTHVGTPVIVAGAQSDPWELIHPGLVMETFAESEMTTAVTALDARSHPSDWDTRQPYPISTALVTGADRRLILMEDGIETLSESLDIVGDAPLGEHVLVLRAARDGGLEWIGVTHHPDPAHPLGPERNILDRVRLAPQVKAHLAERFHPGLTLVISDMAATPDRRSGSDFVILKADLLHTTEPPEEHKKL